MRARDKRQYKEAWQSHIRKLDALAMAAEADPDEYADVMHKLSKWVENATKYVALPEVVS